MSNNGTTYMTGSDDLNESYQGNVVACAASTWAIAAVFVALRFFLRGYLMKVLGREDWTILVSLLFSAGVSASFIVEAHYGLGRHMAVISDSNLHRVTQTGWFANLWLTVTIYLTKISILFLYRRTLTHEWVQRILKVLMAFATLTFLAAMCIVFTACIPLYAVWDIHVHASYCLPISAYYAISGIQLGTDFLVFLLPLPVIWSMRAPRDQRLMLCMLFSFGFFICITSIIRLTELGTTRANTDFTYNSVLVDFWSMIQANMGIVCACIMTMKPLLSRLVPGYSRKGCNGGQSTHDQMAAIHHNSIHPPTIGSKPSRVNTIVKKQSWFTTQLARLDHSLNTVSEAAASHRRPSGAATVVVAPAALEAGIQLPPIPAAVYLDVPRMPSSGLSRQSSIMEEGPVGLEADEGPLEAMSYSRRPSCA